MAFFLRRPRRATLWTALLALGAIAFTLVQGLTRAPSSEASAAAAGPIVASAAVRIIDGDTFDLSGERIRLWGVDAPERRQRCQTGEPGPEATAALTRLIGDRAVSCSVRDTDRYGRTVAVCRAGGRDLGAEMVSEGWAWDYTHYSGGRYSAEEQGARAAQRGVWAMGCEPAWDWRHSGG